MPPLPTQRKIAAILAAYDDLIENNMRRIAILEEMAQALYREWFVHFRFPGHAASKMADSPLGPIPKGWEVYPYVDLLESSLGGDWGVEEPTASDDCAVSVIRGTDFNEIHSGQPIEVPLRYISRASLHKRQLHAADIIVENSVNARSRCVGKNLLITQGVLNRLGNDAICASFCKQFRLRDPRTAPIVHLNLKYLYGNGRMAFYQNVAANGIGNFQAKRFVETEAIALPSDDQLLQYMIDTLQDLVASIYADRIDNLRRTRDLLLAKLISGEVDVEGLDIVGNNQVKEALQA